VYKLAGIPVEVRVFFNNQGKPTEYDYHRSGIAGVTIRPEQRQEPQPLSRKDSDRVKAAVEKLLEKGKQKWPAAGLMRTIRGS
jgi:hypothetical protein